MKDKDLAWWGIALVIGSIAQVAAGNEVASACLMIAATILAAAVYVGDR